MNRDWRDFKSLHSNNAGAREAFEDVCESLFRKKFSNIPVGQIKVKKGDGGIDIYIGELGVKPITVIQCKFFIDGFGESQKNQVRESFKTAVSSDKFTLEKWILCIPILIDIDEASWWFKWRKKQIKEYDKNSSFIELNNGNYLIDELKSLDLYNTSFQIEDSIKIDELHKAIIPTSKKNISVSNYSSVLFNHYTIACEEFYLNRNVDEALIRNLDLNNVWVYGKSGNGKTTFVNRNLMKNQIEYCFCDLSPVTIKGKDDVLSEVLLSLEDSFSKEHDNNEENLLKAIAKLLCETPKDKFVIVIDELSVDDETKYSEIINELNNLVNHYNNLRKDNSLKFIISTIKNPREFLRNLDKASDIFQFLCCDDWTDDIVRLFNLLNQSIKFDFIPYKKEIIAHSNFSPRTLKSIFRKLVSNSDLSSQNIVNLISSTAKEQVI